MIMSGITDETKDKAWEFTKQMAKEMSSPNCTEKDGLGYAAIDNEGKLFGERWVNNKEAFQHRNTFGSEIDNSVLKHFKILSKDKVYGSFGTYNENIRSITLHSRMSTNIVNYKNTHPFVEEFTSLIHNGVISNDEQFKKKYSSCDSEVILHEYIKHNVMNKPGKFKKVASKLQGYYALGIFSRTNEGRIILDVIKDDSAKLESFFIKELNTIVFATPKWNSNPVEDACKVLGFTITSKYEVKDNRLQRIDAMTGETIAYESFKPKERFYYPATTSDSKYNTHGYSRNFPYSDDYTSHWNDIFHKSKRHERNNIIDMTKHSKTKTSDEIKERQLNEMLLGNKNYTPDEVKKMIEGSKEIANEIDKIIDKHSKDDTNDWEIDERLMWSKKNLL